MKEKISVLMGIYNCEATLRQALDCIVAQTYPNWELILCDDGSSDGTVSIAEEYLHRYPAKVKLLRNEKNMGLNITLNRCLAAAEGEFVARMDGDDHCSPDRFEKQLSFLKSHPKFGWVSSAMSYFDENGTWKTGTALEFPQPRDFIPGTPFCHAPSMLRTDVLRSVNGYDESPRVVRVEDYDLWFRLYAKGHRGANLNEPLYQMRDDEKAYKRRKFRYAFNEAYVRFRGYRMLGLTGKCYLYVLRPILVGLLPKPVYMFLHHK